MPKYLNWISDNLNELLYVRTDIRAKELVAIYFLYNDLDRGDDLLSWIESDSGDYFYDIKHIFERYEYKEGCAWIEEFLTVVGEIVEGQDLRIKKIMGSVEIQNKLEALCRVYRKKQPDMLLKISELLDLVAQGKTE
jgi:hypothetical protein